MKDKDIEGLKEAGRASSLALEYARSIIKEGASMLDVAQRIEAFIKEKGLGLAFPVNLSVGSDAAHYTPGIEEKREFTAKDLVKVDLGARRGDLLNDCASTIDLSGEHGKLVDAANEALETAINMVKNGREVREIGREIERIADAHGVKPIRNLGGHGITKTELHAEIFIPNFDNGDSTALEDGQVIAIEPFMTNGEGYVEDGENVEIFQKTGSNPVRSREAREIAGFIDSSYGTYPFAVRWLGKEMGKLSEFGIRRALAELSAAGDMEQFPVLREKKAGFVAQAEKTMVVDGDSCIVLNG
jgi:methionyl aminopeptidase